VARFNGGSNAGHTVVMGGQKHTFHLIPSGALKGRALYIGAGVVLDPVILREEIALLPSGIRSKLVVDGRCSLVSPMDKELDQVIEGMRGASPIGTTKRGIGPAYAIRALRLSPRVWDLIDGYELAPLAGLYEKLSVDSAGLESWAEDSKKLLRGIVGNVGGRIEEINESGGQVLFEGSQGSLLDLLHGSYPFVTSTFTTAGYIPTALGIPPSLAGSALGVTKCYATRVGGGPFPTEMSGEVADEVRVKGGEYGATTGRPRRVGWLDLVALRYSVKLNGAREIAVTKLDVLAQVKEFKVCVAYGLDGSESGDFQRCLGRLADVEPVYESPISLHGAVFERGFPPEAERLVAYLEDRLGVKVKLASFGEERGKTVEL
jgi:adenylosuccinate synthase